MIDEQTLKEIVRRIVEVAKPSRVILFGSHGRHEAKEDSDLDIMVIKPKVENPYEEMVLLRRAVGNVDGGGRRPGLF